MTAHKTYMSRAIELAGMAAGFTAPNPMVGAVLVSSDGRIIAEAYHRRAGEPHAEAMLLDGLTEDVTRDCTLYVNLEPCCHHGRTPPCTTKIINAKISTVVIAMLDPNPLVNGDGIATLRAAGIDVQVGLLEDEARYLNRFFCQWIVRRTPYVTLKIASTLNGHITRATSRHITGDESHRRVHLMRSQHDCILTGSGTVIADNPQLTVRHCDGRNPSRAVCDRRLRTLGQQYAVFADNCPAVYLLTDSDQHPLTPDNVSVITANSLGDSLLELARQNITSVMVEGGSQLNTALLTAGVVDEIKLFMNTAMLSASTELAATSLSAEYGLSMRSYEQISDDDLLLTLVPR